MIEGSLSCEPLPFFLAWCQNFEDRPNKKEESEMKKKRAREFRLFKELSNGQVAMFLATRTHNYNNTEIWTLSVIIAHSKKVCRKSLRNGIPRSHKGRTVCDYITGKCGLEGMHFFKHAIIQLEYWLSTETSNKDMLIQAHPWDERRKRAYRVLCKQGYAWYEPEGEYPYYYKYINSMYHM